MCGGEEAAPGFCKSRFLGIPAVKFCIWCVFGCGYREKVLSSKEPACFLLSNKQAFSPACFPLWPGFRGVQGETPPTSLTFRDTLLSWVFKRTLWNPSVGLW